MKHPLISIIIPCYNQAQYLDECLQSVLDQTYQNWECIIVNDGSPDDTEEIALKWVAKDVRFKYFKKGNGGLSSARNFGIEQAKGEWIQFLDSDDILHKDKLKTSSNFFSDFDVIITNYTLFKDSIIISPYSSYMNEELSFEHLLLNWDKKYSIPIHCSLFRKEKISFFNTYLKAKEDWLFWLDIFKKQPSYKILEDNLAMYRIHENSMTKNYELMYENEEMAYQYIYNQLDPNLKLNFFLNRMRFKNETINNLAQINFKLKEIEIKELKNKLGSKRYKLIDKIFGIFSK